MRVTGSAARFVIFLGGLQSLSLETPSDHALADDFAALRRELAVADPTCRYIFFSYRAGPLVRAGLDPKLAWRGRSYADASEPIYRAVETTDRPIADHVDGLEWLVSDLLDRNPQAQIDLVGFSLGGIVALAWAAEADERRLDSIHRIVLISSPVGGVTPLGRLTPVAGIRLALLRYRVDFGQGLVFEDLQASSAVINRLYCAARRVDVANVENSRDYLVNGRRITGQVLRLIWMRTIVLGRGVSLPCRRLRVRRGLSRAGGLALGRDRRREGSCGLAVVPLVGQLQRGRPRGNGRSLDGEPAALQRGR